MTGNSSPPSPEQLSKSTPVFGILSIVFGGIAMLPFLGIISPIGLILGIIALTKREKITGVIGTSLSVLAVFTSPILWGVILCTFHPSSCHDKAIIKENIVSITAPEAVAECHKTMVDYAVSKNVNPNSYMASNAAYLKQCTEYKLKGQSSPFVTPLPYDPTFISKDDNQAMKNILGVDLNTLRACQVDSDCASVRSDTVCCLQMGINRGYVDLFETQRAALQGAMMDASVRAQCTRTQCSAAQLQTYATCSTSFKLCITSSVPPVKTTPRLGQEDAHKLADGVLVRHSLDPKDFAAPHISFSENAADGVFPNSWTVDYGVVLSTHAQKMQETGTDIDYRVSVLNNNNADTMMGTYDSVTGKPVNTVLKWKSTP